MSGNLSPWPRKGDRLFKGDVDWWNNACLNYLHSHWGSYAAGYKLAGDLLIQHIKNARRHQDTLVYPIVFLYRQYIELRLKQLIKDGNLLLEIPNDLPKHHKIDKLWEQCRRILEKVWPEGPAEDLDAVEERIQQFSERDPTSTVFRYPPRKNGSRSLPGLTHINLRNLQEVMARIGSLLDAASTGISVYLDDKFEMIGKLP